MPCYRPLKAWYGDKVNESGKRSLVFNIDKALIDVPLSIPCGRCIGCRLDRSLSWAVRCIHEASLHNENCFVTLTFDDEHLKGNDSLKVSDFQKFMKRLRQRISPTEVRFFHCGEYGAKFSRPHHHACIFGYDFPDKKLFRGQIYTSELLQDLWPFGFSTVGKVTFESAAYVARYVLKKWSKENLEGDELYEAMLALSNEEALKKFYGGRKPEYVTMSRGGRLGKGLAYDWYEKYHSEIFPSGFVVLPNGAKVKVPKYYDSHFELDNLFEYAKVKSLRMQRALENPDNSKERLQVRGEIKALKSKQLTRGYEDGY